MGPADLCKARMLPAGMSLRCPCRACHPPCPIPMSGRWDRVNIGWGSRLCGAQRPPGNSGGFGVVKDGGHQLPTFFVAYFRLERKKRTDANGIEIEIWNYEPMDSGPPVPLGPCRIASRH